MQVRRAHRVVNFVALKPRSDNAIKRTARPRICDSVFGGAFAAVHEVRFEMAYVTRVKCPSLNWDLKKAY